MVMPIIRQIGNYSYVLENEFGALSKPELLDNYYTGNGGFITHYENPDAQEAHEKLIDEAEAALMLTGKPCSWCHSRCYHGRTMHQKCAKIKRALGIAIREWRVRQEKITAYNKAVNANLVARERLRQNLDEFDHGSGETITENLFADIWVQHIAQTVQELSAVKSYYADPRRKPKADTIPSHGWWYCAGCRREHINLDFHNPKNSQVRPFNI